MNLLETILGAGNGNAVGQLARQFGLDERQAQDAIRKTLPAISSGMRRNAQQEGGLGGLLDAVQRGGHDRYLDEPDRLGRRETVDDGNAILGHILGSKDVSREVARRASAETGIGGDLLKKMLPVIASMAMGAVGKNAQSSEMQDRLRQMQAQAGGGGAQAGGGGGGLGGLLGALGGMLGGGGAQAQARGAQGNDPLGGLGGLLDADGDGNAMDDIFDMVGKMSR